MDYKGIYYPDGENFLVINQLKDNPDDIDLFIDFYHQVYYWKNNRLVENDIIELLNMNWDYEFSDKDCTFILAWKSGGINHQKSDVEIKCCKGWDLNLLEGKLCRESVRFFGVSDIINDFRKKIAKEKDEKEVLLDVYSDTLKKLGGLKMHIGPTFATALMYVASKGAIPIYDQFVGRALDYITDYKLNMKDYVLTNDRNNGYSVFYSYIIDIFKKQYDNRESEMKRWRAVDQALWAYGHIYCMR